MEYKDDDEALLALLAQKEPVSDLSASDVWAHDSLSRAWAAATKEFAVRSDSSSGVSGYH